jgi:hypothetical protein
MIVMERCEVSTSELGWVSRYAIWIPSAYAAIELGSEMSWSLEEAANS